MRTLEEIQEAYDELTEIVNEADADGRIEVQVDVHPLLVAIDVLESAGAKLKR